MKINIIAAQSKKHSLGGIEIAPKRLCEELIRQGHDAYINGKEPISAYDIYDIHYGFNFLLLKKVLKHGKVVVHAHAQPADMGGGIYGFTLLKPILSPYFRYYYNLAPNIITPSQYAADCLRDLGVKNADIKPISNGVPLENFPKPTIHQKETSKKYLQDTYNIPKDKPIIGGIGSLFPRKGIKEFIQIARDMPDLEFIWVGKPQLLYPKTIFKRQLGKLPPNFQFIGYIDRLLDFYYGIDCLLFISFMEMQGIPTLEAAATLCPLIVRDVPVYDWLVHEKNCLKGSNNEEFKLAIQKIIEGSNINQMTENAYNDVQKHDLKNTSKLVLDYFQQVIKK